MYKLASRLPIRLVRVFAFVALAGVAGPAQAFCRTGTCPLSQDYSPTVTECRPPGEDTCVFKGMTLRNVPVWWRPACLGYSVQRDASQYVSVDDATKAAARAFSAWTTRSCPTNGTGTSRVSIDARDLGPAVCGDIGYFPDRANQHVIVFRDETWPHEKSPSEQAAGKSRTIALTTISFDPNSGEIFDADIEINSAEHSVIITDGAKLAENVYDLDSVLTHEVGHFLGIAHSPDSQAVMYPKDEGGSVRHRDLTTDDIDAICTLYPSSGLRPVDPQLNPSGTMAPGVCDPTPRHGFSSVCATAPAPTSQAGCSIRQSPRTAAQDGWAIALSALALAALPFARRSRGRRQSPSRGST